MILEMEKKLILVTYKYSYFNPIFKYIMIWTLKREMKCPCVLSPISKKSCIMWTLLGTVSYLLLHYLAKWTEFSVVEIVSHN
jgi:hypothetical protein